MRIRDLVRLPSLRREAQLTTPPQQRVGSSSAVTYDTADLHDDGSGDDDYEERQRTSVYDPNFVPPGGWDRWIEWAIGQGKIARITQSRAKNAMAGKLVCNAKDKDQRDKLDAFSRRLHLSTARINLYMDYEGRGRAFLEPVWKYNVFGQRTDLVKINFLFPSTVRIFRDNADDVRALKEYLKWRKDPKEIAYQFQIKAGSGFNTIGYVQNYGTWAPPGVIVDPDGDGDPTVFFFPDQLIHIPRYSSPQAPDGLALSRQNYVIIMNKLGIERDQAIMARRHGDPKHKFVIPDSLWGERDAIKKELKKALRAGKDFFFRGRATATDPDPMDVSIVVPSGNPMSVAKAQDHVDEEFVAAMGFADSFTESGSSNRSVGEIQLDFFERDLAPERQLIAEILEDQLINPWLVTQGYKEGSAWFVFDDLSLDDQVKKAQLIEPLLMYLPASVLVRFLENLGYPLSEDEQNALVPTPAPAAADPSTPANPADPQQPAPNVQAALMVLAQKLHRSPEDIYSEVIAMKAAMLASQAGIPKPVLQTAKPARDQFKQEIEDMRDDIASMLGL